VSVFVSVSVDKVSVNEDAVIDTKCYPKSQRIRKGDTHVCDIRARRAADLV